jgi:alpha-methylacyl-CoA racemase
MSLFVDEYLATGVAAGPGHNILTGRFACYDLYECADAQWLTVAAIEPHFWANLCRALGCEQWIDHQTDDDHQEAVRADLRAAFRQRGRDEWTDELGPADCCVAPVMTVAELVDDEQYAARGMFVSAHHPTEGDFRLTAPAFAGQRAPRDADAAPVDVPDWTETQTTELLASAGLAESDIIRLAEEGAIA